MSITIDPYGNVTWNFYRKAYRKARWRRIGARDLKRFKKYYPESSGLIMVI